ncbi:putative type A flavoprotein [Candidatus Vecturithrix granuli]|uniref:Putative type A flavoprotein n=1 Tax=Vecturithrix granuli TaxID=1499967 RepID=A0A081C7V1_VECG1|nr:putative type A flavoprotein [Candidatus Vecturithrix granuli]
MSTVRKIQSGYYAVGAIDWDRRLFDELIPLPDGTSYNAYLVQGSEKTALMDTVDPAMTHVLLQNLEQLQVKKIDYVVTHHAEQDHSGALPRILEEYPEAIVVCTSKCRDMIIDLLAIPEDRIRTVDDGETLSLGDKTMQFIHTPWVHWPETMVTYIPEDRMLFTCDFFGSHLATSDLYVTDEGIVYEAAKRYYAEIMMPFRKIIQKNLAKLQPLDIRLIAPSHGPMYDKPEFIVNAYKDWVSDAVKNEVVLPYVSMHESTRKMVEHFVGALITRGIGVKQFNLADADIGKLAIALVDTATIVLGTPTVQVGPHPKAVYAAYLANALRPKVRFASVIGSYGWSTKMVEQIAGMLSNLQIQVLEPVVAKGLPKSEDFQALDRLADQIAAKHREIGLFM